MALRMETLSSTSLKKMIDRAIFGKISELGYKKSSLNRIYVTYLRNGFIGFVGVLSSSQGFNNMQFINVTFAVSHKDYQTMLYNLYGLDPKGGITCNSMNNLCDLFKQRPYSDFEWVVKNQDDINKTIDEIVYYIRNYIHPFFEQYSNKIVYRNGIESGVLSNQSTKDALLPVIYYMEGNKKAAEKYLIDRELASNGSAYSDALASVFLTNFRKLFI